MGDHLFAWVDAARRSARKGLVFCLERLESRQFLSGSGSSSVAAPVATTNTAAVSAAVSAAVAAPSAQTPTINFSNGFAASAGLVSLNGSAKLVGSRLELTDTASLFQTGSAWARAKQDITSFTTTFSFQLTNAGADGFCFVIQGNNPTSIGGGGGALGYANIPNSVAIKFDLYNNSGEGTNSTGLYVNGATPLNVNSSDLTGSGVDLHSGHLLTVTLSYGNGTLNQTITDTVTNASLNRSYAVNIPATVGGNTAYVGFTGATGGLTAIQDITTWTYTPSSAVTILPAPGGLNAVPSAGSIALAWNAVAGASSYNLYRSLLPSGEGATPYAAGLATPTYTDNAVSGGTTYYYQVSAADGSSTSALSAEVSAVALVSLPPAPTNLSASANSASQITLNWTDNSSNETGFRVEQSTDGGKTWAEIGTTAANGTSYIVGGLAASTSYSFRVRAYNLAGTSAYSNAASATTPGVQTGAVNFANGFANSAGLVSLNGSAKLVGSRLELTDASSLFQAGSAWASAKQDIASFTTTFSFQLTNAGADGFCFVIQGNGPTNLGGGGGALGYANIPNSVAIKFDLYNNSGEGSNSTGLYVNGATPLNVNSSDLTGSGVDLHSGHLFSVTLTYSNSTLNQTITDTVTNASISRSYAVNIPATVGTNTAYVGFTGATGGLTAIQDIATWTYTPTQPVQDTQPPSAPANLSLGLLTPTNATIQWNASTDNVGVAGYSIFRDGMKIAAVSAATLRYTDTGLSPTTTYAYTVTASDAAGNTSQASNALSVTTQAAPPAPLLAGNWKVALNENFDAINPNVWSSRYWWDGNDGTQATFDPKASTVSNGILSITATKQSLTANDGVTNPYTSGMLSTGGIQSVTPPSFAFTYGYIETRTKVAPSMGMWSSIWMLPADHFDDYELDVFENLGRLPNNDQGFLHVHRYAFNAGFSTPTGNDLTQGFHTYGLDWEPDHISWYLDGVEIYRFNDASHIPPRPMYLMLNLDVGGDWAGPLDATSPAQSTWQVDYIRVWQH